MHVQTWLMNKTRYFYVSAARSSHHDVQDTLRVLSLASCPLLTNEWRNVDEKISHLNKASISSLKW